MKVEVIFPQPEDIQWHYPPELPEKDGTYWTITRWKQFDPSLTYTVEYGWNTHRDKNTGNVDDPTTAIKDYAIAWAERLPEIVKIDGEVLDVHNDD